VGEGARERGGEAGAAARARDCVAALHRGGRGESWLQITNALAKELIGVYADVLAWSREEHGEEVSPESVRCLVTSAFIETRRGAR